MPSVPPPGEPVPSAGPLTAEALVELRSGEPRAFGWYVHIPYCTVRCGYCDFNTYTAAELGRAGGREDWAGIAVAEIRRAATELDGAAPPATSVFFGGGTPSLIPPAGIGAVIAAIKDAFALGPRCEITMEANPDTLTEESMAGYRAAGVNRLSIGMQSAVPHVLATLDRSHDPAAVRRSVVAARAAGFDSLNLDLIYAAPGESLDDWRSTLAAALEMGPDHVSAYCLGIEPGTAMHAKMRRGQIAPVDQDHAAQCYEIAGETLAGAGLPWYEISNWARPGHQCRHNVGYWTGADWWAVGPGAHGHVRGVRWWNRRHPSAWAAAVIAGGSPAEAREVLTDAQRRDEAVMLGVRLAAGCPRSLLPVGAEEAITAEVAAGLLRRAGAAGSDGGRLVLTDAGRLVADAVILRLLA